MLIIPHPHGQWHQRFTDNFATQQRRQTMRTGTSTLSDNAPRLHKDNPVSIMAHRIGCGKQDPGLPATDPSPPFDYTTTHTHTHTHTHKASMTRVHSPIGGTRCSGSLLLSGGRCRQGCCAFYKNIPLSITLAVNAPPSLGVFTKFHKLCCQQSEGERWQCACPPKVLPLAVNGAAQPDRHAPAPLPSAGRIHDALI